MTVYHLTRFSRAKKTEGLPTVTVSDDTCPDACAFKVTLDDEGEEKPGPCYAKYGPLSLHWRAVSAEERGGDLVTLCREIERFPRGQPWRYANAGDLPGSGDIVDAEALDAIVSANNHRPGWAYSHKPVLDDESNAEAIAHANFNGFTVNLSANNLVHADELHALGIAPVACVAPDEPENWKHTRTPAGVTVVRCPAEYQADVSCRDCGAGTPLCARQRGYIVGFTPHGVKKRACGETARAFQSD